MSLKRSIFGIAMPELTQMLGSRSRALATMKWLYETTPAPPALQASIPEVARKTWDAFREQVELGLPIVKQSQRSPDGTTKFALTFGEQTVETVRIPAKGRSTVCVSSQAGCTRRCIFCATKELGFDRSLTAAEMVAQYFVARADAPAEAPARNVVFMGMGEPFDNLDAVLQAVKVLTQGPYPQLGARQVTVSTSGVLPGMVRFLKESNASLALSLNATTDEVRSQLMPQTKTWPIAALLGALKTDAKEHPKREHFIEYVLFDGVNDFDDDADRLVALLHDVPARVNLIPHNPFPGSPLKPPKPERMLAFQKRVRDQGLVCLVRWPRGQEIAAACGQLVLAESAQGFVRATA
jgi:23S rRNA (adenine2503-C2)-methyltransferase